MSTTVETRPLEGKVFLLTGASRGIGAATAIELARRGATIIGPHRDPGKNSRAAGVVAEVEAFGGKMTAPIADVTNRESREQLLGQTKKDFGQIDGIIFNHAGGLEKDLMAADPEYHLRVNGDSKLDLFEEAARAKLFKPQAVAIDVPSLWSKFQHTGIKQLPAYDPIAAGKKLGEQFLRDATRTYNETHLADGKEVRFGSVCGHAIGDTATVKLLGRMDREAIEAVTKTAKGGKLPTIKNMAKAIAGMARGNFQTEDFVFVGPPQIRKRNMSKALAMYNRSTRYVDSLVVFDPKRSFGFYRVRKQDTLPHFPPAETDLGITGKDTFGHFTPKFGTSVLPGHKMIAAASSVAGSNLELNFPEVINPKLKGIKGPVEFKVPVLPGDTLSINIVNPQNVSENNTDISVKVKGTEVASISGLEFDPMPIEEGPGITFDRLIEAAAQTLGVAFLHSRDIKDVLPLFAGVKGPINFIKDILPGQLMEMEAVLTEGERKGFTGDVIIRVDDEIVASVTGINCRLFPARGLERAIRMGRKGLE